jgi:UDP-N-acetylmuramate-alanine ligase
LKDKKLLSKEELLEEMKRKKRDVVLSMGAGDIDSLVEPLETILKK